MLSCARALAEKSLVTIVALDVFIFYGYAVFKLFFKWKMENGKRARDIAKNIASNQLFSFTIGMSDGVDRGQDEIIYRN